jgi:hypothetical protein
MMTTACLVTVMAVPALAIPRTDAETASHKAITLPDATVGRIAVLVVGFSKKSKDVAERWENRIFQDYRSAPRIAVLRIAVLASVPKILRGLVRGRAEKNTPPEKRDSFILLFQHEDAWKQLVEFDRPDGAYLLIVDEKGQVRWRARGAADLSGYDSLKAQIDSMLGGRRAP